MDEKQSGEKQSQANTGSESDFQKMFRDRPGMKVMFYIAIGIILLGIVMCLFVGLGWLTLPR